MFKRNGVFLIGACAFLTVATLMSCGKNPVTWVTIPTVTVTNTDTSVNTNTSNYLGCYQDDYIRALPNKLLTTGATVETCTALAKADGYWYAGVQWGIECWAGNTVGYARLPDSDCNMTCNADTAEFCGGSGINSMYSSGF